MHKRQRLLRELAEQEPAQVRQAQVRQAQVRQAQVPQVQVPQVQVPQVQVPQVQQAQVPLRRPLRRVLPVSYRLLLQPWVQWQRPPELRLL